MNRTATLGGIALAFGLGFGAAALTRSTPAEAPSLPPAIVDAPASSVVLAELDQCTRHLAAARLRVAELEEALKATRAVSVPAPGDSATGGEPVPAMASLPVLDLASVEQAGQVMEQFLRRGDIEGLWLLAAELLRHGEPGYQKLIELFGMLEQKEEFATIKKLWRHEEVFMGRFLAAAVEHHEALLRFGLHVAQLEPETLPQPLRGIRSDLTDGMGAMMLGFYRGDDPALLGGYVDLYRQAMDPARGFDDDQANGLAQIPTPEASELLAEALALPNARGVDDIVRALAWQRSPQALTTLRQLRGRTADPALIEVIDLALRYLE